MQIALTMGRLALELAKDPSSGSLYAGLLFFSSRSTTSLTPVSFSLFLPTPRKALA
jgi:hypothetical protein